MPSAPLERHVLGPSESLCELALDLAARIAAYEAAGGRAIVEEVVLVSDAAPYFDARRSSTSRPRPDWRWEILLHDATTYEMIIGAPDGGWSVDGIDLLRGQTQHPQPGFVHLDVPQDLRNCPLPPPDGNDASGGGITGAGTGAAWAVAGPIAGLALNRILRKQVGVRSPRWHYDPTGVHALRYWNGVAWTRFVYVLDVSDGPPADAASPPPPAPLPSPETPGRRGWRRR